MSEDLLYVGRPRLRKDGPDKATGRAKYTVDIQLPGTLSGAILAQPPSPRPHPEHRRLQGPEPARGGKRHHHPGYPGA